MVSGCFGSSTKAHKAPVIKLALSVPASTELMRLKVAPQSLERITPVSVCGHSLPCGQAPPFVLLPPAMNTVPSTGFTATEYTSMFGGDNSSAGEIFCHL